MRTLHSPPKKKDRDTFSATPMKEWRQDTPSSTLMKEDAASYIKRGGWERLLLQPDK